MQKNQRASDGILMAQSIGYLIFKLDMRYLNDLYWIFNVSENGYILVGGLNPSEKYESQLG